MDSSPPPAPEVDSPPPSLPREGRTKWVHDPAHRAEAGACAGGADADRTAGQETADSRESVVDRTVATDAPPAAGQDGGAGPTDGVSQSSGEGQRPDAGAATVGADGAVGEARQPKVGVEPENAAPLSSRQRMPGPLGAPLSRGP